LLYLFDSVQVNAVTEDASGQSVITHNEYPRFPAFPIIGQPNERVTAVLFQLDHGFVELVRRNVYDDELLTPLTHSNPPPHGGSS
jgi:hypothetical protein